MLEEFITAAPEGGITCQIYMKMQTKYMKLWDMFSEVSIAYDLKSA